MIFLCKKNVKMSYLDLQLLDKFRFIVELLCKIMKNICKKEKKDDIVLKRWISSNIIRKNSFKEKLIEKIAVKMLKKATKSSIQQKESVCLVFY